MTGGRREPTTLSGRITVLEYCDGEIKVSWRGRAFSGFSRFDLVKEGDHLEVTEARRQCGSTSIGVIHARVV